MNINEHSVNKELKMTPEEVERKLVIANKHIEIIGDLCKLAYDLHDQIISPLNRLYQEYDHKKSDLKNYIAVSKKTVETKYIQSHKQLGLIQDRIVEYQKELKNMLPNKEEGNE